MYKVCQLDNEYPHTQISEVEYEDWTDAQDEAVRLVESGVECEQIMVDDGLLQELNLERGIMPPSSGWNTHSLTPYYVRLRNYEG